MGKTVLILGNGFDLAHGLPTRYADFLEFAKRVMIIYTFNNKDGSKATLNYYKQINIDPWGKDEDEYPAREYLKKILVDLFKQRDCKKTINSETRQFDVTINISDRIDEFNGCLEKNIWYLYISELYADKKMRGENWIDFESEISYIIQLLDNKHVSLSQSYIELHNQLIHDSDSDEKSTMFYTACDKGFGGRITKKDDETDRMLTVEVMRKRLYDDLEKLIRSFEIYLTDFVEKIPISKEIKEIKELSLDYVISFNYTKTYEEHYGGSIPVCHIHGVCDCQRDADSNDMVIGIDEYVPEKARSIQVDFSIFKKFVQRIRNHNDVSYATWAKEIEDIGKEKRPTVKDIVDDIVVSTVDEFYSDIYVHGHSLDITDKDILRRFLMCDATRIHLFVKDKAAEGKIITNLLKIMDEDEVIRKSTTNPPMINFIILSDNNR